MRRCAGCGRRAPKGELLRIVAADGIAQLDPAGQLPGRGTYACGPACLERLQDRRSLSRALRAPVSPPADGALRWPQERPGL